MTALCHDIILWYVGLFLSYAPPNVGHSGLYAVLIQQLANLHLCLLHLRIEEAIESETELVKHQSESTQQLEERLNNVLRVN